MMTGSQWLHFSKRAGLVLIPLYVPCTWIFWYSSYWSDYRRHWAMHFPLLPGLPPAGALSSLIQNHFDVRMPDWLMWTVSGVAIASFVTVLSLLAWRTWWRIALAMTLSLAWGVPAGYITYALYRL